MQINFRDGELSFLCDKNVKVKSIIPNGEYEYTILFEQNNVEPIIQTLENKIEDLKIDIPQVNVEGNNNSDYESYENELPLLDDIVEYLRSRENIGYDNSLLQEHFLGRKLDTRVEPNLYHRLKDITKKAIEITENEDYGAWKLKGYRNLGKTRRVKQYIFVRLDSAFVKTRPDENIDNLKEVLIRSQLPR